MVVDLWAPWCGPLQDARAHHRTGGRRHRRRGRALAKVNVDENPAISASFKVQSIPAVFALKDGKVVDQVHRCTARGRRHRVRGQAGPGPERGRPAGGRGTGDRHRGAAAPCPGPAAGPRGGHRSLAALLIARGESDEAIALLGRIPETPETRRLPGRGPSGQPSRCDVDRRTGSRDCSTPCSTGSGTTRRPARSSSTSWRPWGPTTRAPPNTARRSPPDCSEFPPASVAGRGGIASRSCTPTSLDLGGRRYDITHRALVMGILNRTPDSFYDKGATFALDDLYAGPSRLGGRGGRHPRRGRGQGRARARGDRGRGAGPGRPGRRGPGGALRHPVSVDTWRASVAEAAYEAGRGGGQRHQRVRRPRVPGGGGRRRGDAWWPPTSGSAPRVPDPEPVYDDVVADVAGFLVERAARARPAGIPAGADRAGRRSGPRARPPTSRCTLLRASRPWPPSAIRCCCRPPTRPSSAWCSTSS